MRFFEADFGGASSGGARFSGLDPPWALFVAAFRAALVTAIVTVSRAKIGVDGDRVKRSD